MMFAPICPLCCAPFLASQAISACRCGHVFHHDCVQSFRDLTKRFKGYRGCPACGGAKRKLETRLSSEEGDGKVERIERDADAEATTVNETVTGDSKTVNRKRRKAGKFKNDSLIKLHFVSAFHSSPTQPSIEKENQRLTDLLGQANQANKRLLGQIEELETKLQALILLLKSTNFRRQGPQTSLHTGDNPCHVISTFSLTPFNHNNNQTLPNLNSNREVSSFRSLVKVSSLFSICADNNNDDVNYRIDVRRSIVSGLIRLVSHALVDYVTSPLALRRDFGRLKRRRRRRRVRPSSPPKPMVYNVNDDGSVDNDTSIDDVMNSVDTGCSVFHEVTDNVVQIQAQMEDRESSNESNVSQCCKYKDSSIEDDCATITAVPYLDALSDDGFPCHDDKDHAECQTDFWYESEWDEDLYEVDWDYEPYENG